jgi:hypothetical protein
MYQSYKTSRGKPEAYEKRRCSRCRGTGDAPCGICGGVGQVPKGADTEGHTMFARCDGCLGRKTVRCPTCGGERFV